MRRVVLGMMLGCGLSASACAQASGAADAWPDYSSWTLVQKGEMGVTASNEHLGNPYLAYLPLKNIGLVRIYANDPIRPSMAVQEFDILGNRTVVRNLVILMGDEPVLAEQQLRVGGVWKSGRNLSFYVDDPEKLLKEGVLAGALLSLQPLEGGPPIELRLENRRQ